MEKLKATFTNAKKHSRPVFVAYLTAGFPERQDTVPALLALQEGGADIIELGVPFSDPIADGPTIQDASFIALKNGITISDCLNFVREARAKGLQVPVVFMGYFNPFLNYGDEKLMMDCKDAGVDGFIIVDLPPEEAVRFRNLTIQYSLSYIPLITPSTTDSRMKKLVKCASSFIYVVSTLGVTGARDQVSSELPSLINRIKSITNLPLAVGFGVSTREHFLDVASHSEGVVIGSKIITTIKNAHKDERALKVREFAQQITNRTDVHFDLTDIAQNLPKLPAEETHETEHLMPARFGEFGGQYAPEALIDCLDEIETAFKDAIADPEFIKELHSHYSWTNRPSNLHFASRLTQDCNGANIWLKREDLNHTGSHKINNALGQVLLAKRLGKKRIIAETGAGQHGVATATVCAKFGLECVIYMGAEDVRRQALNVFRIRLLGAKVIPVESGSKTLKDAVNEAMRDWVTNVRDTHYILGSAIGPHPFPTIVREFQSCIGRETKEYFLENVGQLPDVVIACVGGGSNAIGMFHPFINDKSVRLIGVEAGGSGVESGHHSATLNAGRPGVLHGTKTYLMQDANGQIIETHSISAGLDYPGVGPEHAWLKDSGRAEYMVATDAESLVGLRVLSQREGIIPALETAHAVYVAMEVAKTLDKGKNIVICLSGRGDKDVISVAEALPKLGPQIGWDLRFEGSKKTMTPNQ